MTKAHGSFEITSMDEDRYEELDGGGRLTRAWGEQTFSGDIEGDGAVQWMMSYRSDGTAHLVGLQRITGTIGDRKGSFLIEAIGDHDGTSSTGRWSVLAGSGTGDLEGLRGEGEFRAPSGPKASYELDYELG